MNVNINNVDDLNKFCHHPDRVISYQDCIVMLKNAYCIDYNLYFNYNDSTYEQTFLMNQILGNDVLNTISKNNIEFHKIKHYNKCVFMSTSFYDNFLHFIMELFFDYVFYLELKKFIPQLKFYSHNKTKFIERVNKFGLLKLFNINSDVENDLCEDHYTNTHYQIIIYPYKIFSEIRKCYRFNIYHRYCHYANSYLDTYINPEIKCHNYIYISRRLRDNNKTIADQSRVLLNENALINKLKIYDFHEVFLEDYDKLEDKLYVLRNADIIILQSSATCLLLSMVDLKNIVVLSGPYKISVFPWDHRNNILSIKNIRSDDIKIINKGNNVPWELTPTNLIDIENHIKLLKEK